MGRHIKIRNTKDKLTYAVYFGTACLVVGLSFALLILTSEETQFQLTKEDGFFESLGAITWLIASIVFFIAFRKDNSGNNLIFLRTKRNFVFCLLSIFCFMACGEEISWGQRILKLQTPECLKKINRQNEINLHNIVFLQSQNEDDVDLSFLARMLTTTKFFQAFWFGYCVLLPLASRFSRLINYYVKNMNVPLVPTGLGIFFLANYLISKATPFAYNMSDNSNEHYLVETKECNFGILFMLVSFYFLQRIANDDSVYKCATYSLCELTGQSNLTQDRFSA